MSGIEILSETGSGLQIGERGNKTFRPATSPGKPVEVEDGVALHFQDGVLGQQPIRPAREIAREPQLSVEQDEQQVMSRPPATL